VLRERKTGDAGPAEDNCYESAGFFLYFGVPFKDWPGYGVVAAIQQLCRKAEGRSRWTRPGRQKPDGVPHLMISYCIALATSFVLAVLLTPVARALARTLGLLDRPDGGRKMQRRPIPVGGGPVILLAVAVSLVAVWLACPTEALASSPNQAPLRGLFVASIGICVLGLADDFGRLRGRHKLLGQLGIVSIVIWSGVSVEKIEAFGLVMDLGILAAPFTACLLLGAINSLNLLDGMDGLLSCVATIICLSLAAMAALAG
jgi:UDP-GlcNAc:undecaprenyl-phosphate GlcNAc-1-phosphate transferase